MSRESWETIRADQSRSDVVNVVACKTQGRADQSRSDVVNVAVGFNPRSR